jgi:hypothetical protein
MEQEGPAGYRGKFWIGTRLYWSSALLLIVGIVATFHYPKVNLSNFYGTAAQVIVTLYVAMAIEALAGGGQSRRDLKPEHWVFLVASSAGMLAALRGLSTTESHRWLTGLTVVGITATVLMVAENIVHWRAGRAAPLWTPLFILVAVLLVLLP